MPLRGFADISKQPANDISYELRKQLTSYSKVKALRSFDYYNRKFRINTTSVIDTLLFNEKTKMPFLEMVKKYAVNELLKFNEKHPIFNQRKVALLTMKKFNTRFFVEDNNYFFDAIDLRELLKDAKYKNIVNITYALENHGWLMRGKSYMTSTKKEPGYSKVLAPTYKLYVKVAKWIKNQDEIIKLLEKVCSSSNIEAKSKLNKAEVDAIENCLSKNVISCEPYEVLFFLARATQLFLIKDDIQKKHTKEQAVQLIEETKELHDDITLSFKTLKKLLATKTQKIRRHNKIVARIPYIKKFTTEELARIQMGIPGYTEKFYPSINRNEVFYQGKFLYDMSIKERDAFVRTQQLRQKLCDVLSAIFNEHNKNKVIAKIHFHLTEGGKIVIKRSGRYTPTEHIAQIKKAETAEFMSRFNLNYDYDIEGDLAQTLFVAKYKCLPEYQDSFGRHNHPIKHAVSVVYNAIYGNSKYHKFIFPEIKRKTPIKGFSYNSFARDIQVYGALQHSFYKHYKGYKNSRLADKLSEEQILNDLYKFVKEEAGQYRAFFSCSWKMAANRYINKVTSESKNKMMNICNYFTLCVMYYLWNQNHKKLTSKYMKFERKFGDLNTHLYRKGYIAGVDISPLKRFGITSAFATYACYKLQKAGYIVGNKWDAFYSDCPDVKKFVQKSYIEFSKLLVWNEQSKDFEILS